MVIILISWKLIVRKIKVIKYKIYYLTYFLEQTSLKIFLITILFALVINSILKLVITIFFLLILVITFLFISRLL